MKSPATLLRMVIRTVGTLLIILGIPIWTGNADGVIPIHLLLGIILVLSLWALALVAARAGIPRELVIVAFGWGILAAVLGITQKNILDGGNHWVVQIIHLLVGLSTIGLAEALGARLQRAGKGQPARRI